MLAAALSSRLHEVFGVDPVAFEALQARLNTVGVAARAGEAGARHEELAFPGRAAGEGTVVCTQLPGRGSRFYCFWVPKVTRPPLGGPVQ
jgi:hypothetical protein